MSTIIDRGIIMRIGTYDHQAHPGRDLRSVHPARRVETIGYRIETDTPDQVLTDADGWEHYAYRFVYRFQGRTLTVRWRCGTGYGQPKPIDGLMAAFSDAALVDGDSMPMFGPDWAAEFGLDFYSDEDVQRAARMYAACERMDRALDRVLGDEREAWATVCEEAER